MSQHWIAKALQEHAEAILRHQHYIAVHEMIMEVLHALEQQTITEAQAIAQLEEASPSQAEPGLAALYRQAIERLRGQ